MKVKLALPFAVPMQPYENKEYNLATVAKLIKIL